MQDYTAHRTDNTFEILKNGLPYHVIPADPLYPGLLAEHSGIPLGQALVNGLLQEDHRGESGWISGVHTKIEGFGPLPGGWSDTPPLPSLEEALTRALAALKAKRLAVEYAGPLVDVAGVPVRFPSEVKDETRLNSLAGLFMADPTAQIPDWKIADGVYVTMTAPLLMQVKTAGFGHIAATFSVEREKREAVEALTDVTAVLAWVEGPGLHEGWPG